MPAGKSKGSPPLVGYVREQRAATGTVPDDRTVVVEQLVLESIDGLPALASVHADAFVRAGFARTARGLRLYRRIA
jgi:hypothetical protein